MIQRNLQVAEHFDHWGSASNSVIAPVIAQKIQHTKKLFQQIIVVPPIRSCYVRLLSLPIYGAHLLSCVLFPFSCSLTCNVSLFSLAVV